MKIISRLLPPYNESVADVAKETGIPKNTLYSWRAKHRRDNQPVESGQAGTMTGAQKFDVVLETAAMNEAELSEYCRRNGLSAEQIRAWSETCRYANTRVSHGNDRERNRQLSKENKQLKAELRRKEKALTEAAALLVLKKKAQTIWKKPRGRKVAMSDRQDTIDMIDDAVANGARLSKACDVLDLSPRTIHRWRHNLVDNRKAEASKRQLAHKLTEKERDRILKICHQGQFDSMSLDQILPALADQGVDVASASRFDRVLQQADQPQLRGKGKPAGQKRSQAIEAVGPNKLWRNIFKKDGIFVDNDRPYYNAQRKNERHESHRNFARLSKATFVIYMFFILFGTSMPFRDSIRDIDQLGTSNIVNQIVFSTMFITALISIIPKYNELILFLKSSKLLIFFIAWCGLSTLWSDYNFVSFKRFFQTMTTVIVFIAFLLHISSLNEILRYLKPLIYAYIIISIISVVVVPGAIVHDGSHWRALASSKNQLGQACLVSMIIWYCCLRNSQFKSKLRYLAMLGLSIILLAGSQSMTSIITTIIFFTSTFILHINNHFEKHGFQNLFIIYSIIFSLFFMIVSFTILIPFTQDIMAGFGKDLTFTGRTNLWYDIFQEAKQHPILGTGYAGFWVADSARLVPIYHKYLWIPQQAHLGYLDIFNETGLIGLAIVFIFTIRYYKDFLSYKQNWMQYFIISTLIINLQESTLFRTNVLTGVFFILAYLSLYAQKAGLIKR